MAWDYAYQAAPDGGAFEDLSDYCTSVRIVGEGMAGKRGSNPSIPYQDGEFSEPYKFLEPGIISLDVVLRYTNAAGAVTHTDGAPGHVHENLQAVKSLLGWGRNEHVILRRTAPHMGAVETRVECMTPIQAAGPRMRYVFPLRMLDAVWREQTLSTDTNSSVSSFPDAYTIDVGGDYDVRDPKITFTCVAAGDNPSLTATVLNETISVTGSFATSDEIIVDLGRTRAFTLNGDRYGAISSNRAWWMRLTHDQAALGMSLDADSGTWTVKIDWYNKWL